MNLSHYSKHHPVESFFPESEISNCPTLYQPQEIKSQILLALFPENDPFDFANHHVVSCNLQESFFEKIFKLIRGFISCDWYY